MGMFNRLTNNIPRLLRLAIQVAGIRPVQFLMPEPCEAARAIDVTLCNQIPKGRQTDRAFCRDAMQTILGVM